MNSIAPMFPGWHRKLYGRRPVRPGIEIRCKAVEISSLCLRHGKDLFGDLLATGVLIGAANGPFRGSERNLCRKLRRHVRTGDTIVADSGFCCWFTLYLFGRKGVNVLMRNNSIRKPDPRAAKLGAGDRLEGWRKPNIRPKWISPRAYAGMPDSIAVRVVTVTADPGAGFRTTELQIACTVLDPEKMSASNIGALYQRNY